MYLALIIIEYINLVLCLKSPQKYHTFLSRNNFTINYHDVDGSVIIIEEICNFSHNFQNELLSVNAAAECCKLSRRPKTVHRHATREIIVLSRDLAAMNEGVHGSHLPSSLPLYKLHDDVTWFNLNT